jgi:hypothetical protein
VLEPRRPVRRIRADEPWVMPEVPRNVVYAFKAQAAGKASEHQQRLVLSWLTYGLCRVRRSAFDPRKGNVDGSRATDFVLGMQAVAQTISAIVEMKLASDGEREVPTGTSIARIDPQPGDA